MDHESTDITTPPDTEFTIDAKVLGAGAFCEVRLGTNKRTGKKVAIKTFAFPTHGQITMKPKQKESLGFLRRELDALSRIPPHPNVVRLLDSREDSRALSLYIPYFEGGDCYAWLCEIGKIPVSCHSRPDPKQEGLLQPMSDERFK